MYIGTKIFTTCYTDALCKSEFSSGQSNPESTGKYTKEDKSELLSVSGAITAKKD